MRTRASGAERDAELDRLRRQLSELTTTTTQVFDVAMRRIDDSARKAAHSNKLRELSAGEIASELDPLGAATSDNDTVDRVVRRAEISVANVGETVHNVASELSGLERSIGFLGELATALEQERRGRDEVQQLADSASEAITAASAMEEAIRRVQDSATDTATLSKEVENHAEDGYRAVHHTLDEIERIRELTSLARTRIDALGDRVSGIGDVVRVIQEITEKTNLLALNASIIAAQAGQHGRSFAVVAREIKALAQRTAASTKEITDQIRSIQEESERAITAMANGTDAVQQGFEVAISAGDALHSIRESARSARKRVQHMSRAFKQQSSATKQMVDLVGRVSERAAAFAASARRTQSTERIATTAAELKSSGRNLVELVAKQKEASTTCSDAYADLLAEVTRLQRLERDLRRSLDGMQRGVQGSRSASDALDQELALVREATQQLREEISRLQTT